MLYNATGVIQACWHPLSPVHVCVLTADGYLRCVHSPLHCPVHHVPSACTMSQLALIVLKHPLLPAPVATASPLAPSKVTRAPLPCSLIDVHGRRAVRRVQLWRPCGLGPLFSAVLV